MIQRPDQYNLQHLITQILMNFGFSFLFTIFLTFSEPTSHAFHVGIFCLTGICYMYCVKWLILQRRGTTICVILARSILSLIYIIWSYFSSIPNAI